MWQAQVLDWYRVKATEEDNFYLFFWGGEWRWYIDFRNFLTRCIINKFIDLEIEMKIITTFPHHIIEEFCNGILFHKLSWLSGTKLLFYWSRKPFEIRGWVPGIFKKIEITRTMLWTVKGQKKFWNRNLFNFLTFLRFLRSDTSKQLGFKLEKIIGI